MLRKLEFDEYLYEVLTSVPESVMPDDYFFRNKDMIEEVVFGLYRLYDQEEERQTTTRKATSILIVILNSLRTNGVR